MVAMGKVEEAKEDALPQSQRRKEEGNLSPAEALSHSFYRAKRRRRRQRERRLSIFTSNEFELKTTPPLAALWPRPGRDRHPRA